MRPPGRLERNTNTATLHTARAITATATARTREEEEPQSFCAIPILSRIIHIKTPPPLPSNSQ